MSTEVLHVVTFLSADGRYGGPETVARTLASRFDHEIWGGGAVTDPPRTTPVRRFRAVGLRGRHYSRFATPGLWWALWRRLGPNPPRLVHLHIGPELAPFVCLLVLVFRRARFIAQPHGMFAYPPNSPRARVVRTVLVPLLRRAQAIVALTSTEQELLVRYGLPSRAVTVIANGVEPDPIADTAPTDARPTVAFVGRLHPRKHPERFTAAAGRLGARARFVMAGADQGALATALAADPSRVVDYLGAVSPERARQLLQESDVAVVCSDVEPFGLVAIEAMAARAALLITDSCDLAGELEAAGAALVTSTDPADIAAGIARLLEDDILRSQYAETGRRLVDERYSMSVITAQWAALYRRASPDSEETA